MFPRYFSSVILYLLLKFTISIERVAKLFFNLASTTNEWFNNLLAPQVEEPTAEERERPLGKLVAPSAEPYDFELCERSTFVTTMLYAVAGFYGAYVFLTQANLFTVLFTLCLAVPSVLGVTAGAHRLWSPGTQKHLHKVYICNTFKTLMKNSVQNTLFGYPKSPWWSHRAYKARPPLEALLVFMFLLSNQRSIVTWVRRHRLHHQCSETDADPHNATRGFFFSHFWWMVVKPHPEVEKREKLVDVSDLMNNPIIRFQEKYITPLYLLVPNLMPAYIPTLWGESLYVSLMCNSFRLNVVMHMANCINSVAHLVGYKPVDASVVGTQFPLIGALIFGEGFHNFHHAFPSDFRASEFADTKLNLTTHFIEFMAKIGWAYDLKETSEDVVRNRVLKKGDGSDQHYLSDDTRTQQQKFCCFKFFKDIKNE